MGSGNIEYSDNAYEFWFSVFGENCMWWDFEKTAQAIVRKKVKVKLTEARWYVLRAFNADPDWKNGLFEDGLINAEDARRVENKCSYDFLNKVPVSIRGDG